jgi:hypothetical protein
MKELNFRTDVGRYIGNASVMQFRLPNLGDRLPCGNLEMLPLRYIHKPTRACVNDSLQGQWHNNIIYPVVTCRGQLFSSSVN